MQSFQAKLYAADLPIAGADVEAYLSTAGLHITSTAVHVRSDQITMTVGGFEHHDIFLSWQDDKGQSWSLKPATPEATAFVITHAPSPLKEQFSQWHKRRRSIRMVWGSIASITATLVVSAVLLWWYYDQAVSWVAGHISIANEERLGNSVLEQIESDGDIITKGVAVDAISTIGKQLTKGSAYNYRWVIHKDKSINAFALPGGIIVVNRGLIKEIDHPNELAAVLAHEVQHVENRHSLQNAIHSLGWATALMLVLGDVNVATAVIAHQLGNMYFSRDKEDEADRLGFDALVAAGIKPDGMLTLLQKLEKKQGNDMPEWFSSHPDTIERINGIKALIDAKPCESCKAIKMDLAAVKKDKAFLTDVDIE